jgi:hypothetical protein
MTKKYSEFILPLDQNYLAAIGGVLAQWAAFEIEFDKALWVLRLAPAAKSLMPDVPRSLRKRIDLFRDSARTCFSSCPTLAEKLVAVSGETRATSKDRNLLAHGRWGVGPQGVSVSLQHKGQHRHRRFTVDDLTGLQTRISRNHGTLIDLYHPSPSFRSQQALTSDEKCTLENHHRDNWPPPPSPNPQVPTAI